MRCIQLMDAKFHMTNKYLGRKALAHTKKANEFSPDQYRCRKKHKAINACLNEVLLNDLLQRTQHCIHGN